MGHYDRFYEEQAAESRKATLREQARCLHPTWVPTECTRTGVVCRVQCTLCNLNESTLQTKSERTV